MMSGAWLIRLKTGKSGWIDAIWSLSIALTGLIASWAPFDWSNLTPRQLIIGFCVLVAYSRLAFDICYRTARSGDDPRYLALERNWGKSFKIKLYFFLQIQALCGFILCFAIYLAARNPEPLLSVKDLFALIIVFVAIVGEALADKQLRDFKKISRSKQVCNVGLWRLSRHPNYFFEWLNWVGIAILAMNMYGEWLFGFFALSAPLMMYWLLRYVSGVPHVEKHMLETRPVEFQEYQKSVNVFFPGLRKKAH
jgi:steroid 5-alpha reductase family enzyme